MKKVCANCNIDVSSNGGDCVPLFLVTDGICSSCMQKLFDHPGVHQKAFLDRFDSPILLLQPEPRRVRTANKSASTLFGKDLSRIEGYRGGEVFDCEYAFTEAGCGMDVHCQDCIIRNSIVETFKTGTSFNGISTFLNIKKNDEIKPYSIAISTEKVGPLALVRIDRFEKRE